MINLKLVEVWNHIENSSKGNLENFFLDKVKQEVAEWCPLNYFFLQEQSNLHGWELQ